VTARPPKRLAQLYSVSHSLVPSFQEASVKNVKTDTIWQLTLQRHLGVTAKGDSYVDNLFKQSCITKTDLFALGNYTTIFFSYE